MKKIVLFITLSLISFIGFSQTKGISYQAVIIDPNPIQIPGSDVSSQPYVSKEVWIRFGIYSGTTLQFEELHKTKTDEYGLVNLLIGAGVNTGKAGTFTSLSWDGVTKNIVTNVSFDQGGRYTEVSNQKLSYTPYTLLAETAVKLAGVLPIASGGTGATNAIAARTNLGLGNVDNTADADKPVSIATLAILDTKEAISNKSTNIIADSASSVKYPSVKAIKDYIDNRTANSNLANQANQANLAAKATALETPRTINGVPFDGTTNITIPVGVTPADADSTTKGILQLAGDLSGTAAAPKIASNAVTSSKLANGSVTTTKIADGAISTIKLANGSVTDAKIGTVSGSKVTGDIAGNAATATLAASATTAMTANSAAKLTTARTINGVAFDGTANITITTNASTLSGTIAIANGGTGAATAVAARTNLGLEIGTDVLAQRTFGTAANSAATDFVAATEKGANNGVATLGNNGKIPSVQIPAISFQNVNVVNSDATMIAIAGAQVGSIAIRTDNNNNYVLSALPATTLSNWIALATPVSVSSVNGFAGPNVVLTTNEVAEGASNKYFTDARVRNAITATGPLNFNASTGVMSMTTASTTSAGYLSSADFTTFNNKQTALTAGVDYATPTGNITGNAANVMGIVSIANGGTGTSTATGALATLGAEPSENKSNDVLADGSSTTKFPTFKAIKDYVDQQSANAGVADNSISSAKINGTISIAKGGTNASTAAGARTNLGLAIGTDVMAANFTTTLTGDVTGSGNGSFATTVNSVGGVSSSTIATLPGLITANTSSISTNTADILLKAPLASPALTGAPTAPTAATSDNSTQLATTAYVKASITAANAGISSIGNISATSNAKGATISGTTELILTPADASNGGIVTTGTQTFAGAKTFSNTTTFNNDISVNGYRIGKGAANVGSNVALGFLAMNNASSSGINNVSIGSNTLSSLSTGNNNIAIGANALTNVTTGGNNIAIGKDALSNLPTSGTSNTAIGTLALTAATSSNNTAIGNGAGTRVTSGESNLIVGSTTGIYLTTGSNNVMLGNLAGSGTGTGGVNNVTGTNSVFIGRSAQPQNDGQANQVVIAGYDGTNANTGLGSNTTLIGNTATTQTQIMGALNLPNTTSSTSTTTGGLVVAGGVGIAGATNIGGNVTASSFIKSGGTSSQFLKADGSVDANSYLTGNQTITLTGDVTGSGTGTFTTTLANSGVTSGTYGSSTAIPTLTVDSKGRITAASMVGIVAGVNLLNYTSTTSYAAGGTISGTSLTLSAADGTNPGLISTGAQTIAGAKTFSSDITAPNFLGNVTGTVTGNLSGTATTATNLAGGVSGSIPYQTAAGTTAMIPVGSANQFLTSVAGGTYTWTSTSAVTGNFVPYSGASGSVDLGAYDLTVNGLTVGRGGGSKESNSAFGYQSMLSNTSGLYNTSFGNSALKANTTGTANTAIGMNALANSIGSYNLAIGMGSLDKLTSGSNNIAIGPTAGRTFTGSLDLTTSNNSIYIGSSARAKANSSLNEIVIGHGGTGNGNNTVTIGNSTTVANYFTGSINLTGDVLGGTWSGTTIGLTKGGTGATTASGARTNLGLTIGMDVMAANFTTTLTGDVTGAGNGSFATTLANSGVTSGTYGSSTAIPTFTVDEKGRLTAASTVGITAGVNSLNYTSSTSYAAGGTISGTSLTLAAANGTNPGLISTGAQTIAGAKTFSNTATFNTDVTVNGLKVGSGGGSNFFNTAFGYQVLQNNVVNSTNGTHNTGVGYKALTNNTSGFSNVAIGGLALQNNANGNWNTAVGYNSIGQNASGNYNTGLGLSTLFNLTSGSNNTAIGNSAGRSYGSSSLELTTASEGIFIGSNARAGTNTSTNEIVIGYNSIGNGSNTITLGNTSTTANFFKGDINLTGNLIGGTWSGTAIANDKLANSSTTLGTTTMTLGGTVTSVTGLASLSATNLTGTLSGTATSLATGRTITLTGDVTYTSPAFDGTTDVTGSATLTNTAVTAGSYGSSTAIPTFTVDSKGRLTAAGTVGITAGVNSLNYTSTTSYAAGGTISGTSLTLAAADGTNPGLLSTGAQTIAGAKTFSTDITAPNFLGNATTATTAGNITATSNTSLTSLTNLATVGTITSGTWSATEVAIAKGGTGATTAADARTNLGLGSLATKSTIANADVASGAGIAFSKLNITKADITGLGVQDGLTAGSGISIASGSILVTGLSSSNLSPTAGITNAQLANSTTTLGSTTMTLGGTVTSVTGLASVSSTDFTGALTGNASTATKLATGKTIALTGDVTYTSPAFDGSGNVTAAATLAASGVASGTYGSSTLIPTLTVDEKGRITVANTANIIANAGTLTGTILNASVTSSSLTGVGAITSGTWNGSTIGVAYGGTGLTSPGTSGNILTSNGTAWVSSAPTGVNTMTAISATSNANGATISGTSLTLQPANASFGGVVTTGAQTIAGAKTLTSVLNVTPNLPASGAGSSSTIAAQNGFTTGNNAGGALNLEAGDGNGTGNGGDINLNPGTSITGTAGKVYVNGGDMVVNGLTVGRGKSNDASNTALGVDALKNNDNSASNGYNNTALGASAMIGNTTGIRNTAVGKFALGSNQTGSYNTSVGDEALASNTASNNTAVGAQSLNVNSGGVSNTGIGVSALSKNTSGNYNVAVGGQANNTNSTGSNNVAVGYQSLYASLGTNNSTDNTSIGFKSMGSGASGNNNTAVGSQSNYSNTSGTNNVALGWKSLYFNATGTNNTALGYNAGNTTTSNVLSNGIYIGANAAPKASTNTDETVIGSNLTGNGSNTVTIGNTSNTANYLRGVTNLTAGTMTSTSGVNLTGSIDDFFQYNVQNTSTGTKAQSGYAATANNGTDLTGFAWMGINNSNFNFPTAYNIGAANDVTYIGSGQDMHIANANNTKSIIFSTGTSTTPFFSEKMRITATGNVGIGTASPTASLHVAGTTRIVDGNQAAGKVLTSDASGNATWQNTGGSITTLSATGTATSTASYIIFTGSTASQTVTIPSAVTLGAGRELTIKNVASVPVSIASAGGNLIQDNSTLSATTATLGIEPSNNWMKLVSDGTNWYIFRALF